jgi:hypothetical protein
MVRRRCGFDLLSPGRMHGVLEVLKAMLSETQVHKINQQPNATMIHHRYNMTCK